MSKPKRCRHWIVSGKGGYGFCTAKKYLQFRLGKKNVKQWWQGYCKKECKEYKPKQEEV